MYKYTKWLTTFFNLLLLRFPCKLSDSLAILPKVTFPIFELSTNDRLMLVEDFSKGKDFSGDALAAISFLLRFSAFNVPSIEFSKIKRFIYYDLLDDSSSVNSEKDITDEVSEAFFLFFFFSLFLFNMRLVWYILCISIDFSNSSLLPNVHMQA